MSLVCFVAALPADPLTKQLEIDFGRDVASRNLKGLATRSDGRVLPGPVFTDLEGPKLGEILWTLKAVEAERKAGATGQARSEQVTAVKFVVGTGPEGKVQEVTFNPSENSYTVREIADVAETHAMALLPLPDGHLLIGTSPTAAVYMAKNGKLLARVPLPADSVFDFLALPDGRVLAATGNPGKIYQLDLKKIAAAGLTEGKADEKSLAAKGVTLFGEIRDRNVRRLTRLTDGRVIAGSSPKGNVYAFAASGGAPLILQENRDSEVVDLLPLDDGGFYAGIVSTSGESNRIVRLSDAKGDTKEKDKEEKPGFTGRTSVVRFPANGFPESLVSKLNIALYRLALHHGWLLLTAGEQGDTFGYDPLTRRSLTFAGSASAQLNDISPLGDGRFLLLRNNAPGLALLSFAPARTRELETKRLDLGQPADLGALRFARIRGVDATSLKLAVRTNQGSDDLEGWSPWTDLTLRDGAFSAEGLRGRYFRVRLQVPGEAAEFQLDKAILYDLPQNRRPVLVDFRIFSPNLALIPAAEQPPSISSTLGQLLFPSTRDPKDDAAEKRKGAFMNSQVVPQAGAQIVYWAVTDPDGDALAYSFSIRAENADTWIDLTVGTPDPYVAFDTGSFPEGVYVTRLTAAEQAPRPAKQRLSYTFETDNLLIDRTPPVITATHLERAEGKLQVTVEGRDALSLLEGAEFVLNNGTHESVTHPTDGILDGREEKFILELPEARTAGATSIEILLYDQAGNSSSVRLPLK